MKRNPLAAMTAITLLTLAIPVRVAGQQRPNKQQPRYKLVDLGTLGGPNSSVPTVFFEIGGTLTAGARVISNQGIVTGTADTSTADPLCFFDDCFFSSVFQWQNGVLTNLGALPGSQYSAANWISGNGLIAGFSENGATDPLTGLPAFHAVSWRGGQITDLGTLNGGYESLAFARSVGSLTQTPQPTRTTQPAPQMSLPRIHSSGRRTPG